MEFTGLQFIEPANVSIDIHAHNDFVGCGEFAEESVQSVKEAGINVLQAYLSAWMVNKCKCQGKVLVALLSADLLSHSIVALEGHIYAFYTNLQICPLCQLSSGGRCRHLSILHSIAVII
jgi:hypothetical protein